MSEAKHQYFCTKCGTTRDSLLDHPAIGIGGYSWNCPRCNGPVDSREIVVSEAPKKIWMMENPEAWATRDDMFNTPYIRADIVDELVEALKNTTAHLIAAHNLLQHGGKKAAASNTMLEIMLNDYEKSIEVGRAALAKLEESHD